jgi:hypothetical protein
LQDGKAYGQWIDVTFADNEPVLNLCPQLSKEDEAATEDIEVRREDQEKINKFSRLHQRESVLEEQLKQKQVSDRTLTIFASNLTSSRRRTKRTLKKSSATSKNSS